MRTADAETLIENVVRPSEERREQQLVYLRAKEGLPSEYRDDNGIVTGVTRAEIHALGNAFDMRPPTVQESYEALHDRTPDSKLVNRYRAIGRHYMHPNAEFVVKDIGVTQEPRLVGGEWEIDEITPVDETLDSVETLEDAGMFDKNEVDITCNDPEDAGLFYLPELDVTGSEMDFDENGNASYLTIWMRETMDLRVIASPPSGPMHKQCTAAVLTSNG